MLADVHQATLLALCPTCVAQCRHLSSSSSSSGSSSMQAAVIHKTGGVDVLEYVQDFPKPERQAGQVRLQG
jgi:hypothetical protein